MIKVQLLIFILLAVMPFNTWATRAVTEVRQGLPYNPLNQNGSSQNTDLELSARVQNQLRGNASFNPSMQSVTTNQGEVTLQGTVRTQEEADRLHRAAMGVSGVNKVNNRLTVERR